MIQVLTIAAHVLTWAVAVAAFAFVGRYAVHTWWRSLAGQNVMSMCLVVGVTYAMTGLVPWLKVSQEVGLLIACVVFAAMLAVLLQRHWLLTRADREARTQTDPSPEED